MHAQMKSKYVYEEFQKSWKYGAEHLLGINSYDPQQYLNTVVLTQRWFPLQETHDVT